MAVLMAAMIILSGVPGALTGVLAAEDTVARQTEQTVRYGDEDPGEDDTLPLDGSSSPQDGYDPAEDSVSEEEEDGRTQPSGDVEVTAVSGTVNIVGDVFANTINGGSDDPALQSSLETYPLESHAPRIMTGLTGSDTWKAETERIIWSTATAS